jgi:hypothetical protein
MITCPDLPGRDFVFIVLFIVRRVCAIISSLAEGGGGKKQSIKEVLPKSVTAV